MYCKTFCSYDFYWEVVATRAAEPDPGAGALIKNKEPEPELSLKFKTGAGGMAIWEVATHPGPFLDTNGFGKLTEN